MTISSIIHFPVEQKFCKHLSLRALKKHTAKRDTYLLFRVLWRQKSMTQNYEREIL